MAHDRVTFVDRARMPDALEIEQRCHTVGYKGIFASVGHGTNQTMPTVDSLVPAPSTFDTLLLFSRGQQHDRATFVRRARMPEAHKLTMLVLNCQLLPVFHCFARVPSRSSAGAQSGFCILRPHSNHKTMPNVDDINTELSTFASVLLFCADPPRGPRDRAKVPHSGLRRDFGRILTDNRLG